MKYSEPVNWAKGIDKRGAPERNPDKDHHIGGALVSPNNGGGTNWPPPAFSPLTGLFYVPQSDNYAMYYLTETDPRGATGLGGMEQQGVATAGNLVFGGDTSGNLVAYNAATSKPLWHARLGQVSNAPQTYLLDGKQYVLVAAGDTLSAFYLY
jgi:alcohol dehydrogenase (cytochrome c)